MSSKRPSAKLKRLVAERARWLCEYCRSQANCSPRPFAADHITPYSRGGLTTFDNLALSCGCNDYKGNKTHARDPLSKRLAPLFNPRRQAWSRHFAWSADKLLIIGLTPVGRATVEALRLNRRALINLREVLLLAGKHPPAEK